MGLRHSGLALLFALAFAAQGGGAKLVNLSIRHNGRTAATPGIITIGFDGHSAEVPVKKGRFEVPSGAMNSSRVSLLLTVDGDQIRIPDINGANFKADDWTLVLEDHRFSNSLYPLPKGTVARHACALLFQFKDADGTFYFVCNCRTKSKAVGRVSLGKFHRRN